MEVFVWADPTAIECLYNGDVVAIYIYIYRYDITLIYIYRLTVYIHIGNTMGIQCENQATGLKILTHTHKLMRKSKGIRGN
jgi:hypothetical protein